MSFGGRRGWKFIKTAKNLFAQWRFCSQSGVTLCCRSRLRAHLPRPSLSSGGRPYRWGMNRCRWCVPSLFFCPLQLRAVFVFFAFDWTRLMTECRFATAVTGERPQRGWLAQQERLAVSILLCWLYARGGPARSLARSAQPCWRGKWRPRRPPSVSEMPPLTISLFALFGELSSCLYIVFSCSYALSGVTLGLFTSLSTCLSFVYCVQPNTLNILAMGRQFILNNSNSVIVFLHLHELMCNFENDLWNLSDCVK